MPTKRTPLDRPRIHRQFTPDILDLFARVERTPKHQRSSRAYMDDVHDLHRGLDLIDEYWAGVHVTDDSRIAPSKHLASFAMWVRVQASRKQLRDAVTARQ